MFKKKINQDIRMKVKTDQKIRPNGKQQQTREGGREEKGLRKSRCHKLGHFNEKNQIYEGH